MFGFRIQTDCLEDRKLYLLEENPEIHFGVYCREKQVFYGLEKSVDLSLVECALDDPQHGIYGEVVPVESTEHVLPTYIELNTTTNPTGDLWETNKELLVWLEDMELISEEP